VVDLPVLVQVSQQLRSLALPVKGQSGKVAKIHPIEHRQFGTVLIIRLAFGKPVVGDDGYVVGIHDPVLIQISDQIWPGLLPVLSQPTFAGPSINPPKRVLRW
jgi:hypothetical protein